MSVTCESCRQPKNELIKHRSRLTGMDLFICRTCRDNKFEPRWAIILYGRRHGLAAVAEYINKHRYVGKEISARDFT